MATEVDIGDVLDRPLPTSRIAAAKPAKPVSVPVQRKGPPTDEAYPGWVRVLIVFALIVATWSAIYFLVTAALSLGSGS